MTDITFKDKKFRVSFHSSDGHYFKLKQGNAEVEKRIRYIGHQANTQCLATTFNLSVEEVEYGLSMKILDEYDKWLKQTKKGEKM